MTTTVAYTILTAQGAATVQAEPATPGLYVFEVPDSVNIGAPCRWSIGHHSGLQVARFTNPTDAHAAAVALADFLDWTDTADNLKAATLGRPKADRLEYLRIIEDGGGHLGNCAHYRDEVEYVPCDSDDCVCH